MVAMVKPMRMAPASPDLPTAQGTESRDVPIMVFQMERMVVRLLAFPPGAGSSLSKVPPGTCTWKKSGGRRWSGL